MLDKSLLEILVCPKCKGGLEYERRMKNSSAGSAD